MRRVALAGLAALATFGCDDGVAPASSDAATDAPPADADGGAPPLPPRLDQIMSTVPAAMLRAHDPYRAFTLASNELGVDIAWRDQAGSVFARSWSKDLPADTEVLALGGPAAGGQPFLGAPCLIAKGLDVRLFAINARGELLTRSRGTAPWSLDLDAWTSLGAPGPGIASEPEVDPLSPAVAVYVLGADGHVHGRFNLGTATPPTEWRDLGGDAFVGKPRVVAHEDKGPRLLSRRRDGTLWTSIVGDAWRELELPEGTRLGATPETTELAGTAWVFVRTTDGGLHMRPLKDGAWDARTPWASLAPPPGARLLEVVNVLPAEFIVARTEDGQLFCRQWPLATGVWDAAGWAPFATPEGLPVAQLAQFNDLERPAATIVAVTAAGDLHMRRWVRNQSQPTGPWQVIARKLGGDGTATLPSWAGAITYDESLLVERDATSVAVTRTLLFPATRIIAVRDAKLGLSYAETADWTFDGATGALTFPPSARTPFITPAERPQGMARFRESRFFHERQLAVTYVHAEGRTMGPAPAPHALPRSREKLHAKQAFTLGVVGDSISAGFNASGCGTPCQQLVPALTDVAPFTPPWPRLAVQRLTARHGGAVRLVNIAQAGWTTADALASPRLPTLLAEQPDAVVIALGVNDGNPPNPATPTTFAAQIAQLIDTIRAGVPAAEIILVSPMEVNPDTWLWTEARRGYEQALAPLANGRDVVLVRMSKLHQDLLAKKSYLDLTGNGVNHPNDYLTRWYAQQIAETLAP